MTGEAWRPVPGMEGIYSVSDLGRVRRDAAGRGARAGRILRATIDGRGYRMVDLFTPTGRVKKKVHCLVAEVFIGARPPRFDVRHLDGDKLNNAASNLAYGSRRENNLDQVRHGTHPEARKTHCKRGHEFSSWNTRIESTGSRRCLTCARNRMREQVNAA